MPVSHYHLVSFSFVHHSQVMYTCIMKLAKAVCVHMCVCVHTCALSFLLDRVFCNQKHRVWALLPLFTTLPVQVSCEHPALLEFALPIAGSESAGCLTTPWETLPQGFSDQSFLKSLQIVVFSGVHDLSGAWFNYRRSLGDLSGM